jgi:sugar lactone lactonase YvrE
LATIAVSAVLAAAALLHGPSAGAQPAAERQVPSQPGRSDLPSTYVVSEEQGVLPEGIEVTPAGRIYVTSSGTGDVHVGSVGSATMRTFARGSEVGRSSALGVHADARGRVFVASPSGVDVYSSDGELLARRGHCR